MGKDSVVELRKPGTIEDSLTELLRHGARQLIEQPIEAELSARQVETRDPNQRGLRFPGQVGVMPVLE